MWGTEYSLFWLLALQPFILSSNLGYPHYSLIVVAEQHWSPCRGDDDRINYDLITIYIPSRAYTADDGFRSLRIQGGIMALVIADK